MGNKKGVQFETSLFTQNGYKFQDFGSLPKTIYNVYGVESPKLVPFTPFKI